MRLTSLWLIALALTAAALASPLITVWTAWFAPDGNSLRLIRDMGETVLPGYLVTTAGLCLGVMGGVGSMGLVCATLVTMYDFPGRRHLEWMLVLPMAIPAFIVGFAYTDFFQFSGWLQTRIRFLTGWESAVFPDIRNVWGAILIFSLTLYPYVYLLVRTALLERAGQLLVSARLLGASPWRRLITIAWPLSRPALTAGLALALMETLADFGLSSYFGIQTFSTGVFKAWLVMDDPVAAGLLSSLLLVLVLGVLLLETRARQRMRFHARGVAPDHPALTPERLHGRWAAVATVATALPVILGFVLPAVILLAAIDGSAWPDTASRLLRWSINSVSLAALTAVLAVLLAVLFSSARRLLPHALTQASVQLMGLGYALPGTILVVATLSTLAALDAGLQAIHAGQGIAAWMMASGLALIWAYLIRFTAVAQQAIESGYARLPSALDDASRLLGHSAMSTWGRVHWPLLERSLVTAALLVFVDVMKELPATLVLRPFDHDTLAVVAYQLARDERLGEAAVAALALVLVGLLPVMLMIQSLRTQRNT